ncbi:phenylalanine--tRNA ligase subunit alpha [Fusobacterium perfoetens]|uniref:phenylalanine--tRNA ligase subunit alpha n=1 Tax=Fusobacterium perfoetens TaxID=852 RepID=UPI000488A31D|nr:phenylalanine--tRNA ligase subunit alpha [Fusobacterium perfoetens]MCI6151587.1 phenylalanine--tRNA ligase subunit alpha [Fusobacterium perfoetens]MDY3237755.1 phenylalanine--tRNA ligase subunit alpha [Fusobacterium perfoetens]
MKEKLSLLKTQAKEEILKLNTLQEVEDFRIKYLGKKGLITEISKGMKNLSSEERPVIGQLLNEIREEITNFIESKKEEITKALKEKQLKEEVIDITLSGKKVELGRLHPLTETANLLKKIAMDMGFDVADGPEIELVKYNFDALNIPESHPSRDITDTFYISDEVCLRTQTSPVQVRYMLEKKPPFRMVCVGKVYRPDYDVSHTPMFHQMEGLMVGKDISFANLKAILTTFMEKVFGENTKVRFRPHFFPFTEPSAEMDVECVICKGKGCRVCKNSGWLEIMGCGMVDPEVLKAVGYNPDEVSGFAFGMGIERITMLRHGIDDLRAFFENDTRFLKQFK